MNSFRYFFVLFYPISSLLQLQFSCFLPSTCESHASAYQFHHHVFWSLIWAVEFHRAMIRVSGCRDDIHNFPISIAFYPPDYRQRHVRCHCRSSDRRKVRARFSGSVMGTRSEWESKYTGAEGRIGAWEFVNSCMWKSTDVVYCVCEGYFTCFFVCESLRMGLIFEDFFSMLDTETFAPMGPRIPLSCKGINMYIFSKTREKLGERERERNELSFFIFNVAET